MINRIAILILLNFSVFFRTLRYGMVIDDSCRKFHVKDLAKNWWIRLFRITRYSGYGGVTLPLDHFLTIVLHTSVSVTIYLALGGNTLSFITALLFSIHPVNNQVSIWLNGKRNAVVSILVLLMWALRPYGFLFYLLTPLWHYGALPAISLYLFTDYKWILWGLPILIIMFHKQIINKIGSRWEKIPHGEIKRIRPRKLVILVKMFGYITLHCLLARRMSFYHIFMERFGFSDEDNKDCYSYNKDFWIGLPIIIGIPILIMLNWSNPLGFGLFWYSIFILMWCQFPIGITQAIAARVYYLPLIGLCYALSYILLNLPYSNVTITMIFTYYLTRLWYYMPAYRNIDEFYRYALHEFPEHFRARAHVIQKDLGENRIFYCLHNCGVGIRYVPKDCTLNLLMCQSLMALGAFEKAKEYLATARANLVPGQERFLLKVMDSLQHIIDERLRSFEQTSTKKIQPNEIVEIKSDQIVRKNG